jgi:beta-lactamase superfamily II metal-dependent hydrolase
MLEITVWDVQHGSAAYIKTPNNRHIVMDLGDNGNDFSPLGTLYTRGVRQLDVVAITHPHRDHMDDIYNLALFNKQTLCTPRHLTEQAIRAGNRTLDAGVVTQYLEIRDAYSFPLSPANNLTVAANFGGVNFQVFSPRLCDDCNLNNHSLVMVVSYAGLKMVIPGDNEAPSWKELLADLSFRAAVSGADVLLAPHHGREAGWCAELFEAMGKPRLVLISDGRFGDTSATDRYSKQARGWTVYDAAGTSETRNCVTTRSDGHITLKFGWQNNTPGNFLNVTTSKVNTGSLLARLLSGTLG